MANIIFYSLLLSNHINSYCCLPTIKKLHHTALFCVHQNPEKKTVADIALGATPKAPVTTPPTCKCCLRWKSLKDLGFRYISSGLRMASQGTMPKALW